MQSSKTELSFKDEILLGIPKVLPPKRPRIRELNHAPKRKDILNLEEKKLAIRNALRYFPSAWHSELSAEFALELEKYGRIYMYRFQPGYKIYARPISEYPAITVEGAAIAVFQNWAQYLLTMQYLATMSPEQTLHMYSGHPMGLFPSSKEAPRVVITNGMMIPNYSSQDDWEKFNALGVTQYGQMTAGSYMYIGPQGIVHGTAITVMNAFRKVLPKTESPNGKIFLTAGLGGMSGAQPKAGNIAGCITVCAEVNEAAAFKRHAQGWVDELHTNMDNLIGRTKQAIAKNAVLSLAYVGNVVDVWEQFYEEGLFIHLGSDQTSLHNPWAGGYYPAGLSFEEANIMMAENPELFKEKVRESLRRQVNAINKHSEKGTYFFDYGNAFLLEASRAGADVMSENNIDFRYPSYVQDILGPMCFDFGFGPFRWVCTSGNPEDLQKTDEIALSVMKKIRDNAPEEIQQQMEDNIKWISEAESNKLVVGSQARILYADAEGRIKIAEAFNKAVHSGKISASIVLGRDHHDVSGTDSPFRETSNIYDGSQFTADMAIHNVIGDSFRGASWVSIHNGGGVGWGEVINGGFGMVLDGSDQASERLKNMLFYDVNNGISRRSWARNKEALFAIKREMKRSPNLKVTLPNLVADKVLDGLFE